MKFNYVRFKNFLSYGEDIQKIDLSQPGITLVVGENKRDGGSNGSGKSTATVESVVYALFGKTTKKLKADDVVNNKTRKDCFVEINFSIGKDVYNVRRYRNHSELGNSLILEKNGKDISAEGKVETQAELENIIKISYKSFISSIVLSQEKIANFAEADSLERRRIIENLLMYDFISKYHKATKEVLRTIGPEIRAISGSIDEKKDTIDTLTDNLMGYIDSKEKESEHRAQKIIEIKEELEELKTIDAQKELELRRQADQKGAEIQDLKSKIEDVDDRISSLERKLLSSENRLNSRLKEIKDTEEHPNTCPVCANVIDKEKLDEYVFAKREEVEELQQSINEWREEIDSLTEQNKNLNRKLDKKKAQLQEIKSNCHSDLPLEELENSTTRIKELEQELAVLESYSFVPETDSYVLSTTETISKKKTELKKLRKKIRRLEEEREHYEWWKSALSNSPNSLKSFCINHILTSFNKYIDYYLAFFGYDISYTLNEELEDVIVKDGEEISFGHLSGGEKRSLEVALVFALYEIVRLKMPDNINIIVLDELLSMNFDDVRVGGAVEILSEIEERGLGIYVIDHKTTLKDNLDCKLITVTKDKQGNSTLETE